ncbi:ATP-dependent 5'-3' RNA helicase [Aureococcus anophagefferens]|nr:ATP-dependent 5'-3' RNA helicase [Aureococcus anophagefferens]
MSTKAAAQIIAEYERAIKSDDAPALPCVSPETSAKLETAGSCAAATSYRGFVVGRAASRFLWLAVCIAYAFVRKVVVAILCVAKGALVTARVSAGSGVVARARSGFVAASTASFVVAGLALEYGIRLYGAIRVRAEPFLRARAPEACKFLFPTSPKKDVDLEAAVESVAVSPKSDSPTKRTPKTPAPQPRWVKTPGAEDQ